MKRPSARWRTMTATTADTMFVPIVAVCKERKVIGTLKPICLPGPETTRKGETWLQRRSQWEGRGWGQSRKEQSSAPPNPIADSENYGRLDSDTYIYMLKWVVMIRKKNAGEVQDFGHCWPPHSPHFGKSWPWLCFKDLSSPVGPLALSEGPQAPPYLDLCLQSSIISLKHLPLI